MQRLDDFDDDTLALVWPSGGIFYHYTSRQAAQEISITGLILPSRDGLVYLTDVIYRFGWQATDHLALPNNSAEVAIPVQIQENAVWLGNVPLWNLPEVPLFRRGGAQQWVVAGPIRIDPFPWAWIELEVP